MGQALRLDRWRHMIVQFGEFCVLTHGFLVVDAGRYLLRFAGMALLGVAVVLGAVFYAKAVPKIEKYVNEKLEPFRTAAAPKLTQPEGVGSVSEKESVLPQ